jgi:hypothetical protein
MANIKIIKLDKMIFLLSMASKVKEVKQSLEREIIVYITIIYREDKLNE